MFCANQVFKFYFIVILIFCLRQALNAQQPVQIDTNTSEHIFNTGEISYLEDRSAKLTFIEVLAKDAEGAFRANTNHYPQNPTHQAAYWCKVRINFSANQNYKPAVIEFFDQTTEDIEAYLPDADGTYKKTIGGAQLNFDQRLYQHKNFEFKVPGQSKGHHFYYFRVKSSNQVNVIIVYRTVERFIHYALVEYLTFGLFYGMILVFSLYNLLMYLATRFKEYLYYILYVLSVGAYEMCADGIAFQFIWPNVPKLNAYGYGIALYAMTIFALIFTKTLLQVKKRNRSLHLLIQFTIVLRTVYFLICLLIRNEWFIYKFLEFIPLSVAFLTGVVIWRQGFKPARFFVLAYALLFAGAILKLLTVMGFIQWHLPGAVGHYSISFGFVAEMILLSFSIGDQVRLFRREKDIALEEAIHHMQLNVELKTAHNEKLEKQVAERTRELVVKSDTIREQAEHISRMNILLKADNSKLKTSIEKMTDARIESTELTFDEFTQKYPDRDQCYSLLADLKWNNGFACKKCGNSAYSTGRRPYSRRCKKCFYEESPMQDTIFENNRIPINKAFYIVYLLFTTKGEISSYQIAKKLDLRQSTCWAYSIRIKTIIDQEIPGLKKRKKMSWMDLVMKPEQAG